MEVETVFLKTVSTFGKTVSTFGKTAAVFLKTISTFGRKVFTFLISNLKTKKKTIFSEKMVFFARKLFLCFYFKILRSRV